MRYWVSTPEPDGATPADFIMACADYAEAVDVARTHMRAFPNCTRVDVRELETVMGTARTEDVRTVDGVAVVQRLSMPFSVSHTLRLSLVRPEVPSSNWVERDTELGAAAVLGLGAAIPAGQTETLAIPTRGKPRRVK